MLISSFEAKNSRADIAIFFTQTGRIVKQKIQATAGRYFICEYGQFFIDKRRRYLFGNASVFFYDTRFSYPLNIAAMEELQAKLMAADRTYLTKGEYAENRAMFSAHTQRFLDEMQKIDYAAVHDFWNNALDAENKTKMNQKTLVSPFKGGSFAIVALDDTRIDIVPIKRKKKEGEHIGVCKHGEIDLSDRRNRYSAGKSALYILNKVGQEEGARLKPVNMSAYSLMPEMSTFEPLLVARAEKEIRYTDKAIEMMSKPVRKSRMNILIYMAVAVVGLFAFNYVFAPQLSQFQTNQQISENHANQQATLDKQKSIEELKLQQLQLQNQTQTADKIVTPSVPQSIIR